jgi:hypothetical protein
MLHYSLSGSWIFEGTSTAYMFYREMYDFLYFCVTSFVTVLLIFCKLYSIVWDLMVFAVVVRKVQVCGDTVMCWLVNNYSLLTIYWFAKYTIPKVLAIHMFLFAYANSYNEKRVCLICIYMYVCMYFQPDEYSQDEVWQENNVDGIVLYMANSALWIMTVVPCQTSWIDLSVWLQ